MNIFELNNGALKRLNYVWCYSLIVFSLGTLQQKGISQCLVDYTTYNYFCDLDTLILEAVPVTGTGPFSFIWETGETTQSILIPLALGDYMLTMTDASGCISVINCHIKPFSPVLYYPYNQNACEGDTITLWLEWFRDSIPGATYLWSTGETSWSIELTDDLLWSVTVTDPSTGCEFVIPYGLFDFHPTPYPTIVGPNMLCTGQPITLSVTGGPFGNIYWYPQGVYAPTIDITEPGTYVVYAWSPEAGYCFHTDTITILPGNIILPILNGPPTLCSGQNGSITITNSSAYNGFLWSNGATTSSISITQPGTYTVTVTAAGGCSALESYTVGNGTGASITNSNVPATCGQNNGSINLTMTPSGSYNFNWSNGSSSEDLNNIPGGSYAVTVTSANGCTSTFNVIVPDNPIAITITNVISHITTCNVNNGSIDISITPAGTYTYLWSNGATSQDLNNLAPGNYAVTVSIGVNCISTGNFVVNNLVNVPDIQSVSIPATCGESNGSVDLQISSGQSPYNFLWSNGSNAQGITNLPANSYSVTVTDANGCTSSSIVNVPDNTIPVNISGIVTPNSSCIINNGGIDISLSPAGNYSFLWSNGSTSEDIANVSVGNYDVTVTLGINCQQTGSFTVSNQNIPFSISGNPAANTSCTNPNGSIDISVSPVGTYTYEWSSGETSEDLQNMDAGNYIVSVTNSEGCTLSSTFNIIHTLPVIAISGVTIPNTSCQNPNGSVNISISPFGTYAYLWSDGSTTEDLQNISQGIYGITVTGSNGCSADSSFTVDNQSASFSLTGIPVSNTSCTIPNGALDLAVSPNGPYSFTWSNGSTTEDIQSLSAGVYTVTVSDLNLCSSTGSYAIGDSTHYAVITSLITPETCGNANGSIDVTITPAGYTQLWSNGSSNEDLQNITSGIYSIIVTSPVGCISLDTFVVDNQNGNFTLSADTTMNTSCLLPNGSIDLTVAPAGTYSFLWSNGAISEDLQNLPPGQYQVSVTDLTNCLSILLLTIDNNTISPAIAHTIIPATCSQNNGGISLSITPNAGNTFLWSNGTTNSDIQNVIPGNYSVTVTGSNGCTTTESFVIPNNNTVFTIDGMVNANTSCIAFNGGIDLILTPAGNYSYAWSNGNQTPNLQNVAPGNYSITVTNEFNCSSTHSFVIADSITNPTFTTTIIPATCGQNNGSIDIIISSQGSYSFLWSDGNTTEDLQNVSPGAYGVTVTDYNGCSATGSYTILNTNSSFTISAVLSDDLSCTNPNGAIDISISPAGSYTYLWSNGEVTADLSGLPSGIYQVTISDISDCSASEIFAVESATVLPVLSDIITHPSCGEVNGSIDIIVTPATGNQYQWSTGDITEDLEDINEGIYSVTITDANGCSVSSAYTVPGSNAVNVIIDADLFASNDSMVTCSLQLNIPTSMIDTISWMPSDLFNCHQRICLEQTFSLTESTNVRVMVMDTNGCTAFASLALEVDKEISVYIPNVFSPNDDGANDTFTIFGNKELEEIEELEIFDRWGNCVFINETFPPNQPGYGWNGIYKGQPMNPAVFAYRAVVRFTTGEERQFKGDVTLVR
ncbi:MAG TPA: gliding motility-associated C-terminal domain-containing protein [Saprospiraceae bacterium]|nr:gliding motility-associated C-terminal domain-containing protein [Saprospiraceae bacterium]